MKLSTQTIQVMCLLGIASLLILCLSLIPEQTEAEQKVEIKQLLLEKLGPSWENVGPSDLVKFPDGNVFVITAIKIGEILVVSPKEPFSKEISFNEIARLGGILYDERHPEYNETCNLFVKQFTNY